jgi:hypothetical protein
MDLHSAPFRVMLHYEYTSKQLTCQTHVYRWQLGQRLYVLLQASVPHQKTTPINSVIKSPGVTHNISYYYAIPVPGLVDVRAWPTRISYVEQAKVDQSRRWWVAIKVDLVGAFICVVGYSNC